MGAVFWGKRFGLALAVAFVALFLVQLAKGDAPGPALGFAAVWGGLSALVFTLAGYLRFRRHPSCMLPRAAHPGLARPAKDKLPGG